MNEDLIARLLDKEVFVFVVGGAVGIVAIIFGTVSSMVRSTAREASRREIAAYIAEGSMTPEQGERLMKAGEPKKC
ncbi:MAG: hypothetical protein DYG93_13370 [Leptolyngbya sp. PLA2]|nr:hypothetical protein [Leptolyngbya sp.]MCE7972637.1 hypothetical protein [Leptolyngbya sp. PL-A2]MCQ3941544.1 hypothetical protein [cyanobacterium CYA1]MCZ7634279.1 hypothetical protein [Phycisphaerales bacterium]MDL1905761.1 hypothetical protein [Synechococcales cyanobacterium CNB]GIK20531.1 MAG: hypothetical protein BroJett004_26950 [Planctomycetota bacterium]